MQAAPSVTPVCGPISTNTTWTTGNSPYEVCSGGATINTGITLTVQSSVTVQFLPTSKLTVVGNLLALGAPAQPITFTAVVTAQTPGSWQGITAGARRADDSDVGNYRARRLPPRLPDGVYFPHIHRY